MLSDDVKRARRSKRDLVRIFEISSFCDLQLVHDREDSVSNPTKLLFVERAARDYNFAARISFHESFSIYLCLEDITLTTKKLIKSYLLGLAIRLCMIEPLAS